MTARDPALATPSATVPALFRSVVERYADHVALEASGTELTYAELDRRSNRVAHALLGQGGEEPVATVVPLEPASIVVMLGALKARRLFVPLDPRDPPERIRLVRAQVGALVVPADEKALELSGQRDDDPGLTIDPSTPTLVYFTSGSTGRPKGTVKNHERLTSVSSGFAYTPDDRFAIIVPLAFAGSITPLFGALLSGATGCLIDPATRGMAALAEWLDDSTITVLQTSPSALRAIGRELEQRGRPVDSVRLVILAGESCHWEQLAVARRMLPGATVANVYGTSEAGYVAVTAIEPGEPVERDLLPFRRTFPGQAVEIVDELGNPVSEGAAGEILVRGRDVSLGYWGEPGEAVQRFSEVEGVRSVRTGDRGRLLADGTLEHLGRTDLRVKLHGQMVDLEEVERVLVALPGVEEAVVSLVPGRDGDARLVAHVVPAGEAKPKPRELRLALAQSLPAFMIPSAFAQVDAIARNERGKVDREALRQAARVADPGEREYVSPSGPREHELAETVAEILGLDRVGARDDVYALGADSLSVVELLSAIGERFGVELTPGDLLDASTIEELALRIGNRSKASGGRIVVPLRPEGSGTPFFCVPAGGGPVFLLRRLARALDRPTYSFIPRGFAERALPDRTVEAVATRNLTALRTVQPFGPYLIGGHSFGALVAYEMASQLRAAGETVALLALLDPASSPALLVSARRIAGGHPKRRLAAALRLVGQTGRWILHRLTAETAGMVVRPLEAQLETFFYLSQRMGRRYRPAPYDGRTVVLRTSVWRTIDPHRLDQLLTGEKRLVDVPGGHLSMLEAPHVAVLAALLREELAAADLTGD